MTLQEIEAFVALAETGSINKAALRLHLSQPATTRRLQNFEAAIKSAPVLDRTAKPPVLTPAGRKVLEHCRQVLRAVTELKASGSGVRHPFGDLRIGIAHGLGDVVLGQPLDSLQHRFPGLRLLVNPNWTARLIEEIRSGVLDCAVGLITAEHALPANVHAAHIGPESIAVVAAKDAKLKGKTQPEPGLRELGGKGWILNPVGCGCRRALQRACDRAKIALRVSAEVFGEDLQLAMIARGAGLGLVPRRQLDHSPYRPRLRIIKVRDFALQATIALLHGPALGNLAPAVEQLQAQMAKRLQHHRQVA